MINYLCDTEMNEYGVIGECYQQVKTELLAEISTYSPDFAPADFFLFLKLKTNLK
jgi:hypothetical protein